MSTSSNAGRLVTYLALAVVPLVVACTEGPIVPSSVGERPEFMKGNGRGGKGGSDIIEVALTFPPKDDITYSVRGDDQGEPLNTYGGASVPNGSQPDNLRWSIARCIRKKCTGSQRFQTVALGPDSPFNSDPLQLFDFLGATNRPQDLDGQIHPGFNVLTPGETITSWLTLHWNDDSDIEWRLRWGSLCEWEDGVGFPDDAPSRVLITGGPDTDADGLSDEWTVQSQDMDPMDPAARLCETVSLHGADFRQRAMFESLPVFFTLRKAQ